MIFIEKFYKKNVMPSVKTDRHDRMSMYYSITFQKSSIVAK